MNTIYKAAALALAPMTMVAVTATPAAAQSKLGIAVVNMDSVIAKSAAYATAMQQMNVTYKATIDSLTARQTALEAEAKVKVDALQAAGKAAGGKPTPAIQAQYEAYQKFQQDAQRELEALSGPVQLARAYVLEQINAKVDDALKAAMTKGKVDLVLKEAATESYGAGVDISASVTTELNALVPSVGIVPPTGWQPGRQGQPAGAPANPSQQPQSR